MKKRYGHLRWNYFGTPCTCFVYLGLHCTCFFILEHPVPVFYYYGTPWTFFFLFRNTLFLFYFGIPKPFFTPCTCFGLVPPCLDDCLHCCLPPSTESSFSCWETLYPTSFPTLLCLSSPFSISRSVVRKPGTFLQGTCYQRIISSFSITVGCFKGMRYRKKRLT